MLTPKEKRFLKYWDEQKADGMRKYILLYTIAWTFIVFFIPLAIAAFLNILNFVRFQMIPLWIAIVLSVAIGFGLALYIWHQNENKQKALLRKQDEPVPPGD